MLRNWLVCFFAAAAAGLAVPPPPAAAYFWSLFDTQSGLPFPTISCIAADPGGYLWIGSKESGLSVLDPMYEFTAPYDAAAGLSSNEINAVAFEPIAAENLGSPEHGAVWIATQNGLSILDRKGVFTRLSPRNSSLPGNAVKALWIDRENTKWISVWGKGVCCVDAQFNWSRYTEADGLCSQYILSIREDQNGKVWFGSKGRGVSCLDRDGNWISFSSSNSGLIGDQVRSIAEEPPSKLWFLTSAGVSVFDGQNWMSFTSRNSPLGGFAPTSMAIDASGNKWIGTEGGGLFKLDAFGMWTRFHKDNSSLPDNVIQKVVLDPRGILWAVTPAGLCSMAGFPLRPQSALPQSEFQEPASPEPGGGSYYPFEYALTWENIGETEASAGLSFALPSSFCGGRSWFYAALWADQEFNFNGLRYRIAGERMGGMKMCLDSFVDQASFLVRGGILCSPHETALDKKMRFPFPDPFPEELQQFLLPGEQLPSGDPEIVKRAQALLRPESRGDMYKSLRDIVYSNLIQHAALEETSIGLQAEKEPGEEGATVGAVRDVYQVLENMRGDRHSKARLICTLVRAAGIPARLVMSMAGTVWCQAWVSGIGWLPIEGAHPVYDYIQPLRTYMPRLSAPQEHAVASVSVRDDTVGRVFWNPGVKAYYVEARPQELAAYQQLSRAKLLLAGIAPERESVPRNAQIQMGKNIFVTARQRQTDTVLVFLDGFGRELKQVALSPNGLSVTVNVQDRLFWKFVPRRIGDVLVIENLLCRTDPPPMAAPSR